MSSDRDRSMPTRELNIVAAVRFMSIEHRSAELPTGQASPESQEDDESRASRLLSHLELNWEALSGKRVLDLGAGTGFFKRVAEKHGVDVVSIDRGVPVTDGKLHSGLEDFVIADLDKDHLPFHDESFDFILVSNWIAANARKPHRVEEFLRVLQHGGQLRQDVVVSPEAAVIAEMEKLRAESVEDPEEQQRILDEYLHHHKKGDLPHPWGLTRTPEEQTLLIERSQQDLQALIGQRASVVARRSIADPDEDARYWITKNPQLLVITKHSEPTDLRLPTERILDPLRLGDGVDKSNENGLE